MIRNRERKLPNSFVIEYNVSLDEIIKGITLREYVELCSETDGKDAHCLHNKVRKHFTERLDIIVDNTSVQIQELAPYGTTKYNEQYNHGWYPMYDVVLILSLG